MDPQGNMVSSDTVQQYLVVDFTCTETKCCFNATEKWSNFNKGKYEGLLFESLLGSNWYRDWNQWR